MIIKRLLAVTLILSVLLVSCGDSGNTKKYEETLLGTNIQSPTVPGR